ncbi:TPA: insulinase family protein [Candidatus Ventrenecus avicola]|nr:insulinase family protein [Candidatus Ventrenecus avicola]
MKYKKYDLESIQIYTVKTDKFKNCYLEINFRDDIRLVNACQRNFLNSVMLYNSLKYPTKRDMVIASEELYNIGFSGGTSRCGYNIITTFTLDMLDPKFITEKDYLEKSLSFFFDMIMHPNVIDNTWQEEAYEVVKNRLHINIESYKERPEAYTNITALRNLFPDSYTGKRIVGTHEEIENVTRETLYEEYLNMLRNSICEIVVVGNLDMDALVKMIKKYFHKPAIVKKEIPATIQNPIQAYHQKTDVSHYNQTRLTMIYQMDELTAFERDFVVPIFDRLFGYGALTDKLGKYLRMENSLCYSYGCSFSTKDSYCIISTGLKKENVELAMKWIKKAFQEMLEGDILEEEIETVKQKQLSDIKLQQDIIYMISDKYYYHEVFARASFEEYEEEIPKVTKKDLINLAKKMHLVYTYVLEEGK